MAELRLSREQRELADLLTGLLAKHADSGAVRAAVELPAGHDPHLWSLLCEQVGVAALMVPEARGGAGFGFVETSVALERLGRALAPTPLLATTLATAALLLADREGATDLLARLAAGEIGALAWSGVTAPPGAGVPSVTERDGALSGTVPLVPDGDVAEVLLVPATTADGVGLFAVEPGAEVRRNHVGSMDQTLRLARVEMDRAPATRVGGDVFEVLPVLHAVGSASTAALAAGAARRGLETTVAYSTEREQFGRPIGSFQALKHRMADMLVMVETSSSTVLDAALAVADVLAGSPGSSAAGRAQESRLVRRTSAAKAWSCDALLHVAAETVQLHGGIAITWEHDAHLLLKRAHALSQLFGAPHHHRQRVLAHRGPYDH